MQRTPPLPPELWEQIPRHVRAVLGLVFEGYERRRARLEREGAELREQGRKTSRNASQPPSTDGPHGKRQPPKEPSGRKPGRQPGHPLQRRALVPVEHVNEVVAPSVCSSRTVASLRVRSIEARPVSRSASSSVATWPPAGGLGARVPLSRRCPKSVLINGQLPPQSVATACGVPPCRSLASTTRVRRSNESAFIPLP